MRRNGNPAAGDQGEVGSQECWQTTTLCERLVFPYDEQACRALAEDIELSRPGWMVVWGVFSHRFTAYPLFPVRRRVVVTGYYPAALLERMDRAERLLRIRPEPGEEKKTGDLNDGEN
jgi:hypothetical protein